MSTVVPSCRGVGLDPNRSQLLYAHYFLLLVALGVSFCFVTDSVSSQDFSLIIRECEWRFFWCSVGLVG